MGGTGRQCIRQRQPRAHRRSRDYVTRVRRTGRRTGVLVLAGEIVYGPLMSSVSSLAHGARTAISSALALVPGLLLLLRLART